MKKPSPLQRRLQQYQRLLEISRDLASTLELDILLSRIVAMAAELSEAQASSILLYDEKTNQLYFQAATNMDAPIMQGINVPLEGSIAGWVVQNRQPLIIPDVQHDPRYFGNVEKTTQFVTSSMMVVPLENKGKILGVLEVLNKREGTFTSEDQKLLSVLGAQAAVAIENTRLFQQSDLIAELVHELRTPLASLGTAAYLLQRAEVSTDQRERLATTIHLESQRLNELASAFLDLARLESGRVSFQMKPFDPVMLLDECRGLLTARAEESGVQLRFDLPAGLPRVDGDRDKLKQVLINLLSNAIKYNRSPGYVTVSARQTGEELVIAIRDSGIGISPEEMSHLFEKFFRTRHAEKTAPGTGLGLLISKRIIDSHRGKIEVQSKLGEGTTVTLSLPLRQG